MNRVIFQLAATALLSTPLFAAERIRVSSFSTILTEVVREVGGDRVAVTAHVQPGIPA